MSNRILEIIRAQDGVVERDGNVLFDIQLSFPTGIGYDPPTGVITFHETGEYLIHWWVATETTLRGAVGFALITPQGYDPLGNSPAKTGQVSGFGTFIVTTPGVTMSLVNKAENDTAFSRTCMVKTSLMIIPIENTGPTGSQGATGAIGATGVTGTSAYQEAVINGFVGTEAEWLESLAGPIGATGATGLGVGTIIPFSQGDRPSILMTNESGERSMVSTLGFGSSGEIDAPNDPIEFFTTSSAEPYYAFSMPTDGRISALSASFILSQTDPQIENMITAQLYYSLTFDNTFLPVPRARIDLGTILGDDTFGKVLNGIATGINIPIPAQTKLLLVFYNTTTLQETALVRGVMHGGLLITQ